MLLVFSIICASGYALLNLFQAVYVGLYSFRFKRTSFQPSNKPFQPRISVILCLRGPDPSLSKCLAGLAAQSHPDYQLTCIVDDLQDPALDTVRIYASEFQHPPKILAIHSPAPSRSLKCSALLTAFDDLLAADSTCEVIALIDADAVCDPDWLSDLIAPLADLEIDATTGNRWFAPHEGSLGSWVRQIWNAAAIVQMNLYGIPWGGSLAFRASLLTETKFCDRLQSAFCEDTLLSDVLRKEKRKLHFVNHLVVCNNESTNLRGACRFITRQLLTTRLYHWAWPLVVLHAFNILLLNLLTLGGLIASVWQADWLPAIVLLTCCIASLMANAFLLHWIGIINQRELATRPSKDEGHPENTISIPKYLLAVATSPWVHAWATLNALFQTVISWRGIDYQINPPVVSMLEYKAYISTPTGDQSID